MMMKMLIYPRYLRSMLFVGLMAVFGCSEKTATEHLQSALVLADTGDHNAAIVELKSALQKSPRLMEARVVLGELYLHTQQWDAAAKELAKAYDLGVSKKKVVPLLALAYKRSGTHLAMSTLDYSAIDLTTAQRSQLDFYKVQALLALKEIDEARQLLHRLRTSPVAPPYTALAEIGVAILNADMRQAEADIERLVANHPENIDVLEVATDLYLRLGANDKAVDVLRTYVELSDKDYRARFAYANLLLTLGDMAAAERQVDDLLRLNGNHSILNQMKAIIVAAEGDSETALTYVKTAVQHGKATPLLNLLAGVLFYQAEQYETSVFYLSRVVEMLPPEHPALRMLAAAHLQLGATLPAGEVLAGIAVPITSDFDLFSQASAQLLAEGHNKLADQLVFATNRLADSPGDQATLGRLKLSLQDISGLLDLEASLQTGTESDLTRSSLQEVLVSSYLDAGSLEKADSLLRDWLQAEPDNSTARFLAARLALANQQFEHARALIGGLPEIEQAEPEVQLLLASLHQRAGKLSAADEIIKNLLAKEPLYLDAWRFRLSRADDDEAISASVEELIALQSQHTSDLELRLFVAGTLANSGNADAAMALIEPLQLSAESPFDAFKVSFQLLMQNQAPIEEVDEISQQWYQAYPARVDAVLARLMIFDTKQQIQPALDLIHRYEQSATDVRVDVAKLHFLALNRSLEEGERLYVSLPDSVKQTPSIQASMARIRFQQGNHSRALALAQRAYEQLPSTRNLQLLVNIADAAGEASIADQALARHLGAAENDRAALLLLAERSMDKPQQAIAHYQKLLKHYPDDYIALNNLAFLLNEAGQHSLALGYAQRALAIQPKHPAGVNTYAQILRATGDYQDAIATYAIIDAEQTSNDEIFLNYIEVLILDGNKVLATRLLRERPIADPKLLPRLRALARTHQLRL